MTRPSAMAQHLSSVLCLFCRIHMACRLDALCVGGTVQVSMAARDQPWLRDASLKPFTSLPKFATSRPATATSAPRSQPPLLHPSYCQFSRIESQIATRSCLFLRVPSSTRTTTGRLVDTPARDTQSVTKALNCSHNKKQADALYTDLLPVGGRS